MFHVNSKTETYTIEGMSKVQCLTYSKCPVPFGQRADGRESSFMSSVSVLIIDDADQWFIFSGNLYHCFFPIVSSGTLTTWK